MTVGPIVYDGTPRTRAFWSDDLPHWDVMGRPMFLTIHVAGALPKAVSLRVRRELADLHARGDATGEPAFAAVLSRMERWLDHRRAPAILTRGELPRMIREAFDTRTTREDWFPMAWVIMPSHVHMLYIGGRVGMKTLWEGFKRWTGRQACALLGQRIEPFWQSEWFDHWSRSAEETQQIITYIRRNPVRAGLAKTDDSWPHAFWTPQ